MYGTQWGALTVSGHDSAPAITGVVVNDVDIESATYSGLFFIGPTAIDSLSLTSVTVDAAGTYGIAVDPTASGSATATDVVVTSPGTAGMSNGASTAWTFNRQSGDTGW
jgi:hypothetical protein